MYETGDKQSESIFGRAQPVNLLILVKRGVRYTKKRVPEKREMLRGG